MRKSKNQFGLTHQLHSIAGHSQPLIDIHDIRRIMFVGSPGIASSGVPAPLRGPIREVLALSHGRRGLDMDLDEFDELAELDLVAKTCFCGGD